MTAALPTAPRILDIGCGPGMQTLELARISGGQVTAVDTHQPFLDELVKRAGEAGLDRQIKPVRASMRAMPFGHAGFDLIWCEGAMYMLGFREALAEWKKFLAPRGYVAVTEPCWLTTEMPQEVRAHWSEYPAMTTIESNERIIADNGFSPVGNFVLPDSAWWDDYYDPMEQRLRMLRDQYRNVPHAIAQIDQAQRELEVRRKFSDCYGYVFFVMQAPA